MSSNQFRIASQLLLVIALILPGCNREGPDLVPVTGTIRLDQKPIALASVMFIPEGKGRPAWGQTDEEGNFQLTSFKKNDGAPIGNYKVSIAKVVMNSTSSIAQVNSDEDEIKLELQGRKKEKETWVIPERYANPKTSTLEFIVEAGSENKAIFELKSSGNK